MGAMTAREPIATGASQPGRRDWLFGLLLLAAVLAAYGPALRGGLLWDDEAHVTRPELRPLDGLARIWTELGATQQYYPLTHSAFWLDHRLWGDATLGYHLASALLHALSALLLLRILRRLEVPGALLAAGIFALHPVHAESVAWISELKNTLSGALCLGAALAYLRFDAARRKAWYALAFGLFALALASKSVTATLPAALLVIFWWKRGRLYLARDALPLVPFLASGAAAGLFTAWVERRFIGAEGRAFDLSLVERCLLAGRASWFYLGKLAWPADLAFVYPRWSVSAGVWWQWLYPLAFLALLAALVALRGRSRAPLAAALVFAGTLFPVLGFFNVYPFRYSYVADHFQYLASAAVIALFAAAATRLASLAGRRAAIALLAIPVVLAVLTWRESRVYADVETLYRETLARNPGCALCSNNLGKIMLDRDRVDEATTLILRALEAEPGYAEAHNNLGNALARSGRAPEAIAEFGKAVRLEPDYAKAHSNLGVALAMSDRVTEAVPHLSKACALQPGLAEAHANLGNALLLLGRASEAVAHYEAALKLDPGFADVRANLEAARAAASAGR
jgi:protein O-mannosyl-transferase